jgi:hypothetical protein
MIADGFRILGQFLGGESKNKVSACFFEITYYFKKSFQKPFSKSLLQHTEIRL